MRVTLRHFELILGLLWGRCWHMKPTLGDFGLTWAYCGVAVGHSGVALGDGQVTLEPLWGHVGVTLGI